MLLTLEEMVEFLSSEKGESVKVIHVTIINICEFNINVDEVEYFVLSTDSLIANMKTMVENIRINLSKATKAECIVFEGSTEQIFLNVEVENN